MNIDTGHVIDADEYEQLKEDQRDRYVPVPRDMAPVAALAMAAGDSLFSGKHGGQYVRNKALALARKQKRKVKRKMALASRRRNRS